MKINWRMRLYPRILLGLLLLLGFNACSDPDDERKEDTEEPQILLMYGTAPAKYELKERAEAVKNDSTDVPVEEYTDIEKNLPQE